MIAFDILLYKALYLEQHIMTATAHALVAAAIATSIKDPAIGISLSFLSHPLLDMVPHWDAGWGWRSKSKIRLFTEATSDLIIGVVLALFLVLLIRPELPLWYLFACILASEVLDLAEIPYWFFKWNFPPFSWIYKFQHEIQGKARLPWGIVTQVAAFAAIFLMLQLFKF